MALKRTDSGKTTGSARSPASSRSAPSGRAAASGKGAGSDSAEAHGAELDRRKLGLGVLAFVRVDSDRNTATATRQLEDAIRRLPEVIACHYISGAGTFELQVMATDLDAFSRFSLD